MDPVSLLHEKQVFTDRVSPVTGRQGQPCMRFGIRHILTESAHSRQIIARTEQKAHYPRGPCGVQRTYRDIAFPAHIGV
jgi:hypothetical protein